MVTEEELRRRRELTSAIETGSKGTVDVTPVFTSEKRRNQEPDIDLTPKPTGQDFAAAIEARPPEPVNVPQPEESADSEFKQTPEFFRDSKTGEITGVSMGDKTFIGLSPEEAKTMAGRFVEKRTIPEGGVGVAEANMARREAARIQQIAQQIGVLPNVSAQQLQEAATDWGQAWTAGTLKSAPGILSGAAGGLLTGGILSGAAAGAGAGAAAGGFVTPLALGLGAVGALAGIARGVMSNIESQKKGQINSQIDVLTAAKTNMRQLAMLASQEPQNAVIYVAAYNDQLAQVQRAHSQIQLETRGNLNSWIEDGTDILSDFELFLADKGTAQIYGAKLRAALVSGQTPIFAEEPLQ